MRGLTSALDVAGMVLVAAAAAMVDVALGLGAAGVACLVLSWRLS